MECPGDPIHLCGGGDRLSFYEWNGTLNVWHNPENIGRYEVGRETLFKTLFADLFTVLR